MGKNCHFFHPAPPTNWLLPCKSIWQTLTNHPTCTCVNITMRHNLLKKIFISGKFSVRFWRQYVPLFASITVIVVPIVDFRRKSSRCYLQNFLWNWFFVESYESLSNTLSNTLKASLNSSSESHCPNVFFAIIVKNSLKSIVPLPDNIQIILRKL